MRIRSLDVEGFLCLENMHVDFDEAATIIVGPNGSGKSSIMRAIDVAWSAVARYDDGGDHRVLERYLGAASEPHRGFRVVVGIDLTTPWERALAGAWLRAAVATGLAQGGSNIPDPSRIDELVASGFANDAVADICTGQLTVSLSPGVSPSWEVSWLFAGHGQPCYYLIASRGLAGTLGRVGDASGGQILIDRFAKESRADLDCSFARLVTSGGSVQLEFSPNQAHGLRAHEELARVASFEEASGRLLGFGWVLARILRQGLAFAEGQRLPPKTVYDSVQLVTRPAIADAAAVPLELFLRKNGDERDRADYLRSQATFKSLTGKSFDVRSQFMDGGSSATVDVDIVTPGRVVPIAWAGAGMWEALVVSTLTSSDDDRVLVLDEPAVNLHPTLQRRLATVLAASDTQRVIITHSPFLVPAGTTDLRNVVRLRPSPHGTLVHTPDPAGDWSRAQRLMESAEVRSCLFASGVLLVEGETEVGALGVWLADLDDASPEALNVVLLTVGSDTRFGAHTELLDAFGVPWFVCCDAPVLGNRPKDSMAGQLGIDPAPPHLTGEPLREWWAKQGVATLSPDAPDGLPAGEIEEFFTQLDPEAWDIARRVGGRSKVLRGREFAQRVARPAEVDKLWAQCRARVVSGT